MINKSAEFRKSHRFDLIALIICFIVAFGIWLYVANANRTIVEKTIIITVNAAEQIKRDTDMSIIGGNDQIDYTKIRVELKVTGTETALARYKDDDYSVSIDTAAVESAGRYSLNFKYELPGEDVTFVSISPSYISTPVFVDKLTSRDVALTARYGEGAVSVGTFESLTPVDQKTVKISGPESIINTVETAVVYVNNLAGYEKSTVIKSKTYELFDAYNTPINNGNNYITIEPYETDVKLVIKYTGFKVPVELKYSTDGLDIDVYNYKVYFQYPDSAEAVSLALTGDSGLFPDKLEYQLGDLKDIATGFTISVADALANGLSIPEGLSVETAGDLLLKVTVEKTKIETGQETTAEPAGAENAPQTDE